MRCVPPAVRRGLWLWLWLWGVGWPGVVLCCGGCLVVSCVVLRWLPVVRLCVVSGFVALGCAVRKAVSCCVVGVETNVGPYVYMCAEQRCRLQKHARRCQCQFNPVYLGLLHQSDGSVLAGE